MGDRRQMEHRVRGAAQCHVDGERVDDRLLRHDIARADIFPEHFHHCHAGVLCKLDPL